MKIGQVIREIRLAQGATLEEIALAAETNASNLSRIERDAQGYSPETLDRIAVALGTTVSALHLRMESAAKTARKPAQAVSDDQSTEIEPGITSGKYSALTQDHRELVDEFMTVLLRRQRVSKR
jgi:transcriptional regulator with XRE-family HTH domain